MMKLENFFYKKSGDEKYALESKRRAYKDLTKSSPKFFFLAGDNLPIEPLVTGSYEPHIRDFINYAAACGYADFLIDIGANIGLTSCQSGHRFREIHMFEPNPTCAEILKLNSRIALRGHSYFIYEYGLGESDRDATLKIPVGNMGGAFISDGVNSYSADILAMKDNFQKIEEANYLEEKIHILRAEVVLGELFQGLRAKGLNSGVIKIDVEGYEPVILNAIAKTSTDMNLIIIFESWDSDYNFEQFLKSFGGGVSGYRLKSKRAYKNILHRILKKFSPKHPSDDEYRLIPFVGEDAAGDLVIKKDGFNTNTSNI
jgi:FkbM family methyltransferase